MKILVVLASVVALLALAGCSKYTFRGNAVDPPVTLPDLKLTDTRGASFSLSAQRGRVVLLYFGYTNCPDACPLTLSHLAQAKRALAAQASDISLVFVTTDPERDTASVLAQYVARFDPAIVALRGSPDELASIYQAYHVSVIREKQTAGKSGYLIGHSDYVYVLDKAGRWRDIFDSTSKVNDIASDVRHLLAE